MDFDERLRKVEIELARMGLNHKQSGRFWGFVTGTILLAAYTVGVGTLIILPLLICHFSLGGGKCGS